LGSWKWDAGKDTTGYYDANLMEQDLKEISDLLPMEKHIPKGTTYGL